MRINLEDKTFSLESTVSFDDLTIIRDGLQALVNDAKTSPDTDITGRVNAIISAAEAIGVADNLDLDAE